MKLCMKSTIHDASSKPCVCY